MLGRRNLEQQALLPFENIARKHHLISYKGQGRDNQIFLGGNLYFQFGDLRVETPTHYVVIEVESAGGVTNLVKYWYCLADNVLSKQISKPIILLHVFRQSAPHDYESHLNLWEFLWGKMQKEIDSNRIQAYKFPYHNSSEFRLAIDKFEMSLI